MKKAQLVILTIGIALSACYHKGPHVSIIVNENGHTKTKVQYTGRVIFTDDKMGISAISPGGSFVYSHNDESLSAERDKQGRIVYSVNDGQKTDTLTPDGKRLMAEAVKEIEKAQGKRR